MASMAAIAGHLGRAMGAADIGVELGEHPVGIVAIKPDMQIIVRLEHVGLIDRRRGIVGHPVECLAHERRRRLVASRLPGLAEDEIFDRDRIDPAAVTTPAGGEAPDTSLQHSELRVKIEAALGKLSPEHREVVVLKDVQGLSYKEIADVMESTLGTVMSRLFYARQKLQALLKDEYNSR